MVREFYVSPALLQAAGEFAKAVSRYHGGDLTLHFIGGEGRAVMTLGDGTQQWACDALGDRWLLRIVEDGDE